MSFKIGFTAGINNREEPMDCAPRDRQAQKVPRKSVVEVFFPDRHLACSYYNDMFDLKRGDIVYVDGKLEGLRGRVVEVNYNFKIKLSDYKRVIGVADTNVSGELFMAGSHFIAIDRDVLPFEKVRTWFKAPENEEEEFVSSSGEEAFNLNDLGEMKIDKATAEKGHEYYVENRVVFIEIKDGRARAIVTGTKPYEVEFNYSGGQISSLVCNCYCTGACKHEFATMLQLKETLDIIDAEYGDGFGLDYISAVNKAVFFDFVIDTKTKGSFIC